MKEIREIVPAKANEPVVDLERQFEPHLIPGTGRYPAYRDVYGPEGFQILDYWRAIRKRLWLVIGIAVLVTTLAAPQIRLLVFCSVRTVEFVYPTKEARSPGAEEP